MSYGVERLLGNSASPLKKGNLASFIMKYVFTHDCDLVNQKLLLTVLNVKSLMTNSLW